MTTCTRVVTRHSSRPFSPFFGCHLLFSLSFTKISIYRTFREMGELLIFLNSVVYCENRFKSLEPYYIFFECVYIPANSIPVVFLLVFSLSYSGRRDWNERGSGVRPSPSFSSLVPVPSSRIRQWRHQQKDWDRVWFSGDDTYIMSWMKDCMTS